MLRKNHSFLLLFICFLFLACENKSTEQNASIQKLSFNLNLNEGKNLAIKARGNELEFDNEQKATLFVFFTTWCAPCLAEIPHLNKLQEKYQENFKIVGVLLEDKEEKELEDFVQTYNIQFELARGENNFVFAQSLGGVFAIPTLFLYSSNGQFFNQYLGLIPQEMLDIDIQKAIM